MPFLYLYDYDVVFNAEVVSLVALLPAVGVVEGDAQVVSGIVAVLWRVSLLRSSWRVSCCQSFCLVMVTKGQDRCHRTCRRCLDQSAKASATSEPKMR
jgi:hypothetical protein